MTTLLNLAVSIAVGILVTGAIVFGGALLLGTAPISLPIGGVIIATVWVAKGGR